MWEEGLDPGVGGGGCLGWSKALSTLISLGQVTTPDDALLLGDHSNGLAAR